MSLKLLDSSLHAAALLFLTVIGLSLYCVMHVPSADEEQAREARIAELAKVKKDFPKTHVALLRCEKELKRSQARAEHVRQRIPNDPSEAEFLQQLAEVANASGLKIRDYRRGTLTVKDCYSQLQIDLSCSAPYPALCGFFELLQRLPRIFAVEQLTIASPTAADGYPVELSLSVYFRNYEDPQEGVAAKKNG